MKPSPARATEYVAGDQARQGDFVAASEKTLHDVARSALLEADFFGDRVDSVRRGRGGIPPMSDRSWHEIWLEQDHHRNSFEERGRGVNGPSTFRRQWAPSGDGCRRNGAEVASLDSLGAPFWSPPEQFLRMAGGPTISIPRFSEPEQDGGSQLHLGFTPGTLAAPQSVSGFLLLMGNDRIGFKRASREGFRWGISGDSASWQGGRASGAFGDHVRSMTTWVGRNARVELDDAWTLNASATLAFGRAFLQSGSMLDVDPYAMSAWDVGVERGKEDAERSRESPFHNRFALNQAKVRSLIFPDSGTARRSTDK